MPTTEDLQNRFMYHAPRDREQIELFQTMRELGLDMAVFINAKVPAGREQALALTKLEEVIMWANAGIARHAG